MKRLRRLLDALGPFGVAGLGVFFFCIPFYFSTLAPLQAEAARREAAAERLRAPRPAAAAGDGVADVERFYRRFPTTDALNFELEAIYAHARASKLQLLQGEYRLEAKAGGLTAYRVTLPVRGTYPQVRQFVGTLLTDMPTASLDALRFERKRAADSQLEAQVRLTIYLRPGPEKRS